MNSDEPLSVTLRYIGKQPRVIYNWQRNENDVIIVPASVAERLKEAFPGVLVQISPKPEPPHQVLADLGQAEPVKAPPRRRRKIVAEPPTDLDEPLTVEVPEDEE